ncbi:hypothetical protein [Oceanobacillus halophilus]|uniref:Sigma-X negative effector n=1 Tax=Oceanobacillus halophilus TaxID=930130 RepID=A0A495AD13_9BACI|nr:hypothetical protein [Oceanobacillus halophilus]RKQ37693.1 hypothetical protein D8M06_02495 [Oceanobacillus halophilus]
MKHNEWNVEEIKEQLKRLPNIEDSRDKNILYQRISSDLKNGNDNHNRRKLNKLLPILGSVVAILLIGIIPLTLNNTSFTNSEQDSMYHTQSAEDSTLDKESTAQEKNAQKFDTEEEQGESSAPVPEENIILQMNHNQLIRNSLKENEKIIYGAISDEQFQYAIPVTFIIPKAENLSEHYNKLEDYLSEEGLITDYYMLEDVSYNILTSNQEVEINLPDNFSVNSSAQAYMFEKLIEAMFVPMGLKKATFHSANSEGVELGPYGQLKEMSLDHESKESYKLYSDDFLVPIPHEEESTVNDAILEMKRSQEEFDIIQTIPNEIDFDIKSSGNELELIFDGDIKEPDNQQLIIMIEAILMTAKSYGYNLVQFQNMPLDQVGSYNLSQPLKVPEAVNPYEIEQ